MSALRVTDKKKLLATPSPYVKMKLVIVSRVESVNAGATAIFD